MEPTDHGGGFVRRIVSREQERIIAAKDTSRKHRCRLLADDTRASVVRVVLLRENQIALGVERQLKAQSQYRAAGSRNAPGHAAAAVRSHGVGSGEGYVRLDAIRIRVKSTGADGSFAVGLEGAHEDLRKLRRGRCFTKAAEQECEGPSHQQIVRDDV